MRARDTRNGGRRIRLAGTALLVAALLAAPTAGAYAQDAGPGSQTDADSWITSLWSTLWSGLGGIWSDLQDPVESRFSATSDGGSTDGSTDDSTDTETDGGLDPGGGGGFLDPDGAF